MDSASEVKTAEAISFHTTCSSCSLGALLYTNCTLWSLGGSGPSVVKHWDLYPRKKQQYLFAFFQLLKCSSWSTVLFIFWYPIHIAFLLPGIKDKVGPVYSQVLCIYYNLWPPQLNLYDENTKHISSSILMQVSSILGNFLFVVFMLYPIKYPVTL